MPPIEAYIGSGLGRLPSELRVASPIPEQPVTWPAHPAALPLPRTPAHIHHIPLIKFIRFAAPGLRLAKRESEEGRIGGSSLLSPHAPTSSQLPAPSIRTRHPQRRQDDEPNKHKEDAVKYASK